MQLQLQLMNLRQLLWNVQKKIIRGKWNECTSSPVHVYMFIFSHLACAAAWVLFPAQDLVVADFGCGDGELALTVKQVRSAACV